MRKKDKNIFYSLEDELEIKIKRKSILSDWFENFKPYSNPYAQYVKYGWSDVTQAVNVAQPYIATDSYYSNLTYATTDGISYISRPVYYTTGTGTYYGN
jgi:hypothetical protein